MIIVMRNSVSAPTASQAPAGVALLALAAILLTALNLRMGITQVGPVIEQLRADTGMSSSLAGALGTIPFACFGIFAFAGAPLIRRFGTYNTIRASLALVAVGTLGRAVADSSVLILLFTGPIGAGGALVGVAVPAVIKHRFESRAASATGIYVAGISGGAALAALATVPLADLLGGWREAFAVTALIALLPIPLWSARRLGAEPAREAERRIGGPTKQTALLALLFGLACLSTAAMINWIAAVYINAGWSEAQASFTTATLAVLTFLASLVLPLVTSTHSRPWWIFATGASIAAGLTGMALAPTTLSLLWLALAGVGIGSIFPLAMMLPLDLHDHPSSVAEATGWMLGIGYLVASTGPALVGALRDRTAGFEVPLLVIAACGLAAGLLGLTGPLRRRPEAVTPSSGRR
jgi:CP family cyanate transporter-like MFS transporter